MSPRPPRARPRSPRSFALACGLASLLAVAPCPAVAATGVALVATPRITATEQDLKAAYLLNFLRFVERTEPTSATTGPYTIAVVGDEELTRALERAIASRHVEGRAVVVEPHAATDSLGRCDLVFIGLASAVSTERVLVRLRGAPVLTVGDSEDFLDRGGMIGLFFEDRRLRFDIDLDAAERSGLRFSSRLLSLALEVRGRAR